MNVKGKLTFFPEVKENKDGKFIVCRTTISSKNEDESYLNMSVEVRFSKEVAPKEKLAKLDTEKCYQFDCEEGFLTCDSYKNKDGKEVRFLVIFITKGKITGSKSVNRPAKEVNNDDLPF